LIRRMWIDRLLFSVFVEWRRREWSLDDVWVFVDGCCVGVCGCKLCECIARRSQRNHSYRPGVISFCATSMFYGNEHIQDTIITAFTILSLYNVDFTRCPGYSSSPAVTHKGASASTFRIPTYMYIEPPMYTCTLNVNDDVMYSMYSRSLHHIH
jgi:hypothetical protein